MLGASSTKLEEIYAAEVLRLTSVNGGVLRHVITADSWREYLGQKKCGKYLVRDGLAMANVGCLQLHRRVR